jgi:predicted amidohydrolase
MQLRIAGAQMPVTRDVEGNAGCLLRAVDFAAAEGAQVLLTPEGSLSGYTHEFDMARVGEGLEEVLARAREARIALALGTCFVEPDGRCYNQIRFYQATGEFVGFHSKTLTCGTLEQPSQGEINHFAVAPLRTFELAGVRVGGLICNDLWANPGCTPQDDPHLTQQLSRMGARIILHAVNGGRDGSEWSRVAWQYHESNLRMRARAGRLWIVTVDSADPVELPCSAPSGVIDPDGNWLVQAPPQGEQHFVATVLLRC